VQAQPQLRLLHSRPPPSRPRPPRRPPRAPRWSGDGSSPADRPPRPAWPPTTGSWHSTATNKNFISSSSSIFN
jgi:hypothetical protein